MKNKLKFSIITPCLNADKYIHETLISVINNSAVTDAIVDLEYIVCDGQSSDGTIEIIENVFSKNYPNNISLQLFSEKDDGLYDALCKGLKHVTGDICAYINAGDLYSPQAFEIVNKLFCEKSIQWLTGISTIYNENGHIVSFQVPFKYRTHLIQRGFYGQRLPFIQQESTFWDKELNKTIDLDRLKQFKYAGDYYLWKQFSTKAQLQIVEAWLSGFRRHSGQLSNTHIDEYYKEMDSISDQSKFKDHFQAFADKLLWLFLPNHFKKRFNNKAFYRYDHDIQQYI